MIKTVLRSLRKSAKDEAPAIVEKAVAKEPAAEAGRPVWHWPNVGATGGKPVYYPQLFEAWDLQSAKVIAVTGDDEKSADQRWIDETAFTVSHVASRLGIGASHRVIDFGCGAGRMSRALIENFGCEVVGVDIAQGMREQARAYVDSPLFTAASPQEFDALVAGGMRANFGIACWSLQHCPYPRAEIARIAGGLDAEAPFMLLNSNTRLVPTDRGWLVDEQDLDALMRERFDELERLSLPPEAASEGTIRDSSLSWWKRRG